MAARAGREADIDDASADLQRLGAALDLHVLDNGDGVAVVQDVADRVADDRIGLVALIGLPRNPLVPTDRTDNAIVHGVGVFGTALRTARDIAHSGTLNPTSPEFCHRPSVP